ncbi:MAG: hypothetical protein VX444_07325 [Pseudomonadota bacterium]|nr:hypothetical protein [Pseudomonadota bacterium]
MSDEKTYPEGFDALMQRARMRRVPMSMEDGEDLPGLDADLHVMRTELTIAEPLKSDSSFAKKARQLQQEFEGQPQLCWLNGFVIANLRKEDQPDHAAELFQKIWAEHSEFLLRWLPLRWLVSSITTFGDRGVNEAQRSLGRSMTMLFGMIKLYEFERLYTGKKPAVPHSTDHKINTALPLDIPSYSLKGGGLDVALLTRLWADSDKDPVIEPLAKHLLNAINDDPGTLFRRLQVMSGERKATLAQANTNPLPVPPGHIKRNPKKITWAVAATVNEDLDQAVAFAAHHIDMGADQVVLYGEDPNALPTELAEHPKISVVLADDNVISPTQRERLPQRNARKAFYFNRARRKLSVDWLAMLDTDERMVFDGELRDMLAEVPKDAAFITMPVVEKFAGSDTAYRRPSSDWNLPLADQQKLYPTYHGYVANLMLGPSEPRLFLRAKLKDIRVGNYVIKHHKKPITNGFTPAGLQVAHNHARDFRHFLDSMPRRMDQGYARRGKGDIDIRTTLSALSNEPFNPELQQFFDEIATARPDVIEALTASGDLVTINLNTDEKIDALVKDITQLAKSVPDEAAE